MYHFKQGHPTRQGHKGIPEGQFEEEQGLDGFYGPVSHLIKRKPSTRWQSIEGPLKPRMYDFKDLSAEQILKSNALLVSPDSAPADSSLLGQRLQGQRLFYNSDITVSILGVLPEPDLSQIICRRNADGDWLYFVHEGRGSLLTEYGLLEFTPGTYIVVPKCIGHSFLATEPCRLLVIENRNSHYREPDRGMLGRHAPWDPNALVQPNLEQLDATKSRLGLEVKTVWVKHSDQLTKLSYSDCVYDVTGWKGDLYPYTLHMDHIMPILSHRVHLPPSVHTTFVARGFVVCSFLPRPMEEEKDALRVPFYHQNIDYDEILFYHDGDFFSRDGLHAGMLSFHPSGFPHGPHPKAFEKVKAKTHTDEKAVMIDTRWPLLRDIALERFERKEYWQSWMK